MNRDPAGTTGADAPRDAVRRTVLKTSAGAALATLAPATRAARPPAATVLDKVTLSRWRIWADTLVPGAAAAGAAEYLVAQLALPPHANTLFLRYMDWPGSHAAFYRDALDAVDGLARRRHGRDFAALDAAGRRSIVDTVAGGQPEGWAGPPAGLFYFVTKADAADLVFGTRAGVERLGLDYRAHIEPPTRWPVLQAAKGRGRA